MYTKCNVHKKPHFQKSVIIGTIDLLGSNFRRQFFNDIDAEHGKIRYYLNPVMRFVVDTVPIKIIVSNRIKLPLRNFRMYISCTCAMRIQFRNSLKRQIHSNRIPSTHYQRSNKCSKPNQIYF